MRRFRRWISLCGMAIGFGLCVSCTTASVRSKTTKADGSTTDRSASVASLNGETVGSMLDLGSDIVTKYGGLLAGGGVLSVLGVGKVASFLGSRRAHKERDARDATWDEARRST